MAKFKILSAALTTLDFHKIKFVLSLCAADIADNTLIHQTPTHDTNILSYIANLLPELSKHVSEFEQMFKHTRLSPYNSNFESLSQDRSWNSKQLSIRTTKIHPVYTKARTHIQKKLKFIRTIITTHKYINQSIIQFQQLFDWKKKN